MPNKSDLDVMFDGVELSSFDIKVINYTYPGMPTRKDGGGLNVEGLEGVIPLNRPVYNSSTATIEVVIEGESTTEVHEILRKFKTWVRSVDGFRKVVFNDNMLYSRYGLVTEIDTIDVTDGLENAVVTFNMAILFRDAYEYIEEPITRTLKIPKLASTVIASDEILKIYNDGAETGAIFHFGHDEFDQPYGFRKGRYTVQARFQEEWRITANDYTEYMMAEGYNTHPRTVTWRYNSNEYTVDRVEADGSSSADMSNFSGTFIRLKPGWNVFTLVYSTSGLPSEELGPGFLTITYEKRFN